MGSRAVFAGASTGLFPLLPSNVDNPPILEMLELFSKGIVENKQDFGSPTCNREMGEVQVDAPIKGGGIIASVDLIFGAKNIVQGEEHVVMDTPDFRSHTTQRLRRIVLLAQNFVPQLSSGCDGERSESGFAKESDVEGPEEGFG